LSITFPTPAAYELGVCQSRANCAGGRPTKSRSVEYFQACPALVGPPALGGAGSAAVVVDFVVYLPRPSRLRVRGLPVECELRRGAAYKEPQHLHLTWGFVEALARDELGWVSWAVSAGRRECDDHMFPGAPLPFARAVVRQKGLPCVGKGPGRGHWSSL